jgi:hypothetical protein
MTRADLANAFEPLAVNIAGDIIKAADDDRPLSGDDLVNLSFVSAAQSLKRIADTLNGVDFQMLDNWAQTIAWNAGRSFEAGRRQ